MKRIYKYKLHIKDFQFLELPKGYEILKVDSQFYEIFIWALVDPEAKTEQIELEVFGTGNPIDNFNRKYLGTAFIEQSVCHVFQRIN
ncbi:DUF7352 domain-containing protein [Tenacibaculum caenipelagi]|uniref:DUF7352 domain-containing protein n=1 Tax=Tenacibaculum caenipelagi TaxID=1325435 RepID=A0A4R6TF84_9FLAO|nr:hypothetical protein [Tenacibaculum caenipelagi]TDQ22762.1 hypothetical protein DFQ07_2780 [Tenacibaculum caenipelagi]TDQ22765.1 hypothetical protein DFQ07_2783 [Tenacibaculum caenipelagi]